MTSLVDQLVQEHRDTQAKLLCIGHGGLYWIMRPLVLTNIDTEFVLNHQSFPHASLIVSELRTEGLVFLEWNGFKPQLNLGKDRPHIIEGDQK